MGHNEYRAMLENAVSWGFNGVSDWFDMDDCLDPFAKGHSLGLGEEQWLSKKASSTEFVGKIWLGKIAKCVI